MPLVVVVEPSRRVREGRGVVKACVLQLAVSWGVERFGLRRPAVLSEKFCVLAQRASRCFCTSWRRRLSKNYADFGLHGTDSGTRALDLAPALGCYTLAAEPMQGENDEPKCSVGVSVTFWKGGESTCWDGEE